MNSIEYKDGLILVEYFKFNKSIHKEIILNENVRLKWFDSVKGNIKAPRLIVEADSEVVFVQYAIGKWCKGKLLEIYDKFSKY